MTVHSHSTEDALPTLKVLVLDGSPYNRGLVHGNTMRDQIHRLLVSWKAAFADHLRIDADVFIKRFLSRTDFVSAMKRWTPELLEEVKGIADGAGVDFDTMLVYQFADEYIVNGKAISQDRCSSVGFSTKGNQPSVVAQNMEIESYADGFQLVLHITHPAFDLESYVLTLAGCIALNGMNNKAIGICCNALTQLSNCRDGLPVACIVRGVLQQSTEDDSIAFLHRIKHASGQNYVIGGPGNVHSFECSAGTISRFKPNGREDVVWHTNHPLVNDDYVPEYRALLETHVDMNLKEPNTRTRMESIEKRLATHCETWHIDLVKRVLSSGDSVDYPVCRPRGQQYA